jgi:hypothetical protein
MTDLNRMMAEWKQEAREIAESYINGNIGTVMHEILEMDKNKSLFISFCIYQDLLNVTKGTAIAFMERLSDLTASRYFENYKELYNKKIKEILGQYDRDALIKSAIDEMKNAIIFFGCNYSEDMEEEVEIRIRLFEGTHEFKTGSSQYDTDHRGAWGSTSVTISGYDYTEHELEELAETMVDEALLEISDPA